MYAGNDHDIKKNYCFISNVVTCVVGHSFQSFTFINNILL